MAFQTKKSVMAIVEETTEGTPVAPSAATDFIATQEGFETSPGFEVLENAENTGSIGVAKPILGFESPTASLSHYIRHSGVEGQEPNYALLLEAAFGDKEVEGTEYDTVGGSTAGTSSAAATIEVDTGEGVQFERGQPLLIKDATNGYSIRPVLSVSGDTLTLGFNLGSAPASGVNLGKAVLYKPGESHPTLSVWDYRANGAAIQLVAGARVTELSIEANAGELVNGSFSMEGIGAYFDPIVIDATNDSMDFDDGGGEENVTVAQETYKDPHELAAALQTAMDAATADNITVTYSDSTGKFTIASDGGTLSLLWNTGTNTATTIGSAIGFATAADDTGATSYVGDNAIDLSAQYTPSYDDSNPLVAKSNTVFLGDYDDNVCFSAQSVSLTLTDEKADELSLCADSGKAGSVISSRVASVTIVANLTQYEADKWRKFRENETTSFMYAFGTKSGGNWEAGKCAMIYIPTGTISSFALTDNDGLVTLDMTLSAFVASGAGEVYLGFL